MEYDLSAPLVVAGEESADEAAIRERSIELLFSKKDLEDMDQRISLGHIMDSEDVLGDFGRTLLNTALKVPMAQVGEWYKEGKTKFNTELPGRVVSNLACCYAGLKLLEMMCTEYAQKFEDVFHFKSEVCVKYLEYAATSYLLDDGVNNQSVVEQTFEIMSRMNLDSDTYYKIEDGKMYLWLTPVYDLYTKYRRDYAIVGEVLTYPQFKKQLKYSKYFVADRQSTRFGKDVRNCVVVNYDLLRKNCDVEGFENTDIVPLV